MQLGGLQRPTQMPNKHSTCVLDAYLNSILNSHQLSKYAIERNPNLNTTTQWNGKFDMFYAGFLHDYVQKYFTFTTIEHRDRDLNNLRLYMEYLHNAKEYEQEIHHITLNSKLRGYSVKDVYKFIIERAREYAIMENENKISSIGSTGGIIEEILTYNPNAIYVSDKNIDELCVESNITDIFIEYAYSEKFIKKANDLYESAIHKHGEFICTDIILDQFQIQEEESQHSVFYNMFESVIQNDDKLYYVPLSRLMFKQKARTLLGVIKHIIQPNSKINECFYTPDNMFGYYIPTILHFQRIDYDLSSTKENTLKRLEDYKRLLLSQTDVSMFIPKYRRHANSLSILRETLVPVNDVVKAYRKWKHDKNTEALITAVRKPT